MHKNLFINRPKESSLHENIMSKQSPKGEADAMAAIDSLYANLTSLKSIVEDMDRSNTDMSKSELSAWMTSPNEMEQTHIRLSILALTHTLYEAYMLLSKTTPEKDHSIHQELQRVQIYQEKLKKLSSPDHNKSDKKQLQLNLPGAIRSIRSALWQPSSK